MAALGSYNPHTKTTTIEKEKAKFYLEHGAQPSDRVARLLKVEGVKLPGWVKLESKQKRAIRNPDKLRRNRPATEEPEPKAEVTEQPSEDASVTEEVISNEGELLASANSNMADDVTMAVNATTNENVKDTNTEDLPETPDQKKNDS